MRIPREAWRYILVCTVALLCLVCKKNPVGPQLTTNVQLSVDYLTCKEVWLKLRFAESTDGGDYRITRDDSDIFDGTFTGSSVVLYDTTAQPGNSYTYVAYRLLNGRDREVSAALRVTTLDLTSNDFTWQSYYFGGNAGSSLMHDVSIVNDSNVWVAGVVGLLDSAGKPDPQPYSVLHWNGSSWSITKVKYLPPGWIGDSMAGSGSAVFADNADDIWLVSDYANHFDGLHWTISYNTGAEAANRIWSDFVGDWWFVGRAGQVAVYKKGNWLRLNKCTTLDLQDVWGISDSVDLQEVVAVACDRFTNDGSAVLELSTNDVNQVQSEGLPSNVSGVWSAKGKEWYICGDGLYKTKSLDSTWHEITGLPSIYKEAIRGNGPNDIMVVGDFGLVSHFDGSSWYTYPSQPGNYYAVAVRGNLVVAVGQIVNSGIGGEATILVGKRNQ